MVALFLSRLIHIVEQLLATELPLLMKMLPSEAECRAWAAEEGGTFCTGAGGSGAAAATAPEHAEAGGAPADSSGDEDAEIAELRASLAGAVSKSMHD